MTAYNTAFKELLEEGYLVPKDSDKEKETRFLFYEKSKLPAEADQQPIIENEKEKVEKIQKVKSMIDDECSEYSPAVVLW